MISEKMLLGSEHAHDFSRDVECYNAHTLISLLNSRDEIVSLGFRNPFCFSRLCTIFDSSKLRLFI